MASSTCESKAMKIIVPTIKPRNPLVAAVKFRKSGAHAANKRVARNDDRKLND
jgi:hypothetical protein